MNKHDSDRTTTMISYGPRRDTRDAWYREPLKGFGLVW